MTAEELLQEIERLKDAAKQHEHLQRRALAAEERARLELESLTEKLTKLFGTDDWGKAEQLLPQLQMNAEAELGKVRSIMEEAGLV
jgi:hypothetical protein